MRILVVQESDWLERGPHQSHHLFERLRQRGHLVQVVDFEIGWRSTTPIRVLAPRQEFKAPPKVVQGSLIEVTRPAAIHLPIFDYVSAAVTHSFEFRKQLRVFNPDVIVGFGLLNTAAAIWAARRAGIPFVYYLLDELHRLVPEAAFRGLARVVEQANVRRASLVLSINRSLRDYTIKMGAQPERSFLVPTGVDLDRKAGKGSDVRKRHGLRADDLVLFFMGWVYPFSGVREVATRIAAGDGSEASAKLLVVGRGDGWSGVESVVEKYRAGDRVKLVGFRPYAEMASYLAAADVCLLPALDVGTMRNIVPIKMYEYMAAGKPVIATRLQGLVKEFPEGRGVVYVDQPSEIVMKAVELAREGVIQELGQRAREFVSGNDWEIVTDRFESLLSELTAGARAKRFSDQQPSA